MRTTLQMTGLVLLMMGCTSPAESVSEGEDGRDGVGTVQSELLMQERVGAAGAIFVSSHVAFGLLKENQTIVRSPSVPECVMQLGSMSTPLAFGGTLTIGGDAVGQEGGLVEPMRITPEAPDFFYGGFTETGAFFPRATGQKVVIRLEGSSSLPKIPPTTLRSPKFADSVRVTSPTPTASGELVANASTPLVVSWNVPSGPLGQQKMVLSLFSFASESMIGELRCGFALAKGKGTIPAEMLTTLKNRLGPGPAFGFIHARVGDFNIVSVNRSSYTLEVTHDDGETFAEGADTPMMIE